MWDLWRTMWHWGRFFSEFLGFFPPVNIIPPLLHIHLSPSHEVCDSSDHAAHYRHHGPKLEASFLTRHIGWKRKKKVKKKSPSKYSPLPHTHTHTVVTTLLSLLKTFLEAAFWNFPQTSCAVLVMSFAQLFSQSLV
jgi:hypothetical protein